MLEHEILTLHDKYINTSQSIIKENMIYYIKNSTYSRASQNLADKIGVSLHTVHSYRKATNGTIPDFVTACKLAFVLGLTIDELIKPLEGKPCKMI